MIFSTDSNHSAPSTLLHHWVVAGIVSSSSRFIPVPFIDDIVRDQCRRYVVSRTLAAHDQRNSMGVLKPFYANEGGCIAGCLGQLAMAPLKLLLFPIRKVIALVTSVRGVPLEIMRMVLLGRTLDRNDQRRRSRREKDSRSTAASRNTLAVCGVRSTFRRNDVWHRLR